MTLNEIAELVRKIAIEVYGYVPEDMEWNASHLEAFAKQDANKKS